MGAKITAQSLYAAAATALGSVSVGSAFDLTTGAGGIYAKAISLRLHIDLCLIGTTAPVSPVLCRLQGRSDWTNWTFRDIAVFATGTTAAVSTTINGASGTAGATAITTNGSATFSARSRDIFFYKSGTLDESEVVPSVGHVTTTLTLSTGLRFAQPTATAMYDQAMQFAPSIWVADLQALRVVVDNNRGATGSSVYCRANIMGWK